MSPATLGEEHTLKGFESMMLREEFGPKRDVRGEREDVRNAKLRNLYFVPDTCKWLRWSRGSVLAFGAQVRGFKPGRSRRIFQGEKILSTPSFGREVKPFVPCRRFTACKNP